ncbi:MAG: exonuclease domain-containing protein [Acholeplasmataceae bacterium]
MKYIIYDINKKKNTFYCLINGQKVGFYLTKSLQKIFIDYLDSGYLVDFEINDFYKSINKMKHYQVSYFNKIEQLKPYRVLYDLEVLRDDMKKVITQYDNYLFLDFEMTMPPYSHKNPFVAEIIQFGAILTDNKGNELLERNYYVSPQKRPSIRTIKFLDLDLDEFQKEAKAYEHFYLDLKQILKTYQPKIVVWGKNDIIALDDSYKINELMPLTDDHNFFNLLVLHKDYFNINQDIGLFKAYQTYFPDNKIRLQKHNALDDARVTKSIFFEFLKELKQNTINHS